MRKMFEIEKYHEWIEERNQLLKYERSLFEIEKKYMDRIKELEVKVAKLEAENSVLRSVLESKNITII